MPTSHSETSTVPRRFGTSYGSGTFIGELGSQAGRFFSPEFDLTRATADQWQLLVEIAGFDSGCPVVPVVLAKFNPEVAWARYLQINYWFGHINQQLHHTFSNPNVWGEIHPLTTNDLFGVQPRQADEPVGQVSLGWMPAEIAEYTVGVGTYCGYVLPRLWILGWQEPSQTDKAQLYVRLNARLAEAASKAQTAEEVVVFFAMGLAREFPGNRTFHLSLLKYLLNDNMLTEENWRTTYQSVYRLVRFHKSELWNVWHSASPEERSAYELAPEPRFRSQWSQVPSAGLGGQVELIRVGFSADELQVLGVLRKQWPLIFNGNVQELAVQFLPERMLTDRPAMLGKLTEIKSYLGTLEKGKTGQLDANPHSRAIRTEALKQVRLAVEYFLAK